MRFFDCFPFSRELDLLELRFEELGPVVDRFVLVESTRDYQLNPKPLLFFDNLKRYERWLPKVTHVVVDKLVKPEPGIAARYGEESNYHNDSVWAQHRHQRNQILVGLKRAGAENDDVCLIADADEIPARETVRELRWSSDWLPSPKVVPTRTHFFFMDLVCEVETAQRLVVAPYVDVKCLTPNGLREAALPRLLDDKLLGWHYSYFGTPEENVAKLSGMCETSFLSPALLDVSRMRERMVNCTDPLDRPFPMRRIDPLGEDYPETVKADRRRWQKYFSASCRRGAPVWS